MTHRYIWIAGAARLMIAQPETYTALNAEAHDALAAFDALVAKRASVWTAL